MAARYPSWEPEYRRAYYARTDYWRKRRRRLNREAGKPVWVSGRITKGQPRVDEVRVWLRPDERSKLQRLASAAELSMSELIRRKVLG